MTHSGAEEGHSHELPDDVFQIGVTRDVVRSDGTLVFAPFGFEALDRPSLVCPFLEEIRESRGPRVSSVRSMNSLASAPGRKRRNDC